MQVEAAPTTFELPWYESSETITPSCPLTTRAMRIARSLASVPVHTR
jgi:hypothetical protein